MSLYRELYPSKKLKTPPYARTPPPLQSQFKEKPTLQTLLVLSTILSILRIVQINNTRYSTDSEKFIQKTILWTQGRNDSLNSPRHLVRACAYGPPARPGARHTLRYSPDTAALDELVEALYRLLMDSPGRRTSDTRICAGGFVFYLSAARVRNVV